VENTQENLVFPLNNEQMTPEVRGFLDEHGVKIEPRQVPLYWACWNGHIFKLQDARISTSNSNGNSNPNTTTETTGNKDVPIMQEAIQVL
jgi:hypothetical protein